MELIVSNVGRLVQGHVLDVNRKQFELELKRIEERLYLKWNPKKQAGFGLWEIRIRPLQKTAVFKTKFQGSSIFELEYKELDIINHVLDVPYLNYQVLSKLREMDTEGKVKTIQDWDYLAKKQDEKYERDKDQARRDLVKENRKYFADLKEYVRSGYNPAWFFSNHKK